LNNLQKTRLLLDSFEWPMRQCVDPFAIWLKPKATTWYENPFFYFLSN
jgi:hypothetical protein